MEVKSVTIRKATREDCVAIMGLRKELSEYSNMGHLPTLSPKDLEHDGFDIDPPAFQCLVADVETNSGDGSESKVMGYALYFYAYAAWEGKTIQLEDLCVSKNVRGGGIGSKLIKALAKIAVDEKCARIQLEVGKWNHSGQKFYNSHGGWNTTEKEGWHNFRLGIEEIKKLAAS